MTTNLILEKAAIFIDGGYFSRVLRDYFKETDVDYEKLSNTICLSLKVHRLRTYFYHCRPIVRSGPKHDQDAKRLDKMESFLAKLRRLPRFEVKLGRLQMIGNHFRQKKIDVLMSLDIADMSFDKQIEHAILIAGDSDFVPAVKSAKDRGVIVHLYYHPKSVHNEILDIVDEHHEITKELVNKSKIKS